MKKVLYPMLAVIAFILVQAFTGIVLAVVAIIKNHELLKQFSQTGDPNALMNSLMGGNAVAWALILSGILTVGIVALLKMIDWKTVLNVRMINWKVSALAIIGGLLSLFFMDILSDLFDLPDEMEDFFVSMSTTVVGALSIGVIGPIAEEFIFRESILGYMLRNGVNKWVAITASALAFGIIHMNPAQIPFAMMIGFIFGIIYYKTGNIVITSILHIVNNSVGVAGMILMGEEAKDASLVEWLGGQENSIFLFLPSVGILAFVVLRSFWNLYKTAHWVVPEQQTNDIHLNTQDNETIL